MKRGAPLQRRTEMPRGNGLRPVSVKRQQEPKRQAPRKETGFTPATKLLIRTRAGNGDPDQARCEATGVWLGRHGGEIQHRNARRLGGSRLRNNVANGVLLSKAAHRLAESRSAHMHAAGMWLLSTEDSLQEPIMLHGLQGGVTVWLTDDGQYADSAPEDVAA